MKTIAAHAVPISAGGQKHPKSSSLLRIARTLLTLTATVLAIAVVACAVLIALLHPTPGEWALPVRAGPWTLQIGVPSVIRLANTPPVAQLLHGRHLATPVGTLAFGWQPGHRTLSLRCTPCRLQLRALGPAPLVLDSAELTVQRFGEALWGTLAVGKVAGRWQGQLSPQGLRLAIDLPPTPLQHGFAALSTHIPELARARIAGRFALQATLDLPASTLHIAPHIEGFGVSGLGTEALRGALPTSACTPRDSAAKMVGTHSTLARAVLAAEDQRFATHPGYDLGEWVASVQSNQSRQFRQNNPSQQARQSSDAAPQSGAQRLRGASTITQQLARLLFTGADRTPARKLRELLYAVEMERTLGKTRILQLYLQNAPWGDGVCGAEAAAQHYFQRPAARLQPAQAVWLAAMLHAPGPHANAWRHSGRIDTARAQWVASQVRPLTRRQRAELQRELSAPGWVAPGVGGDALESKHCVCLLSTHG